MDREETTLLLRRARGGAEGALDALFERCAAKLLPAVRVRLGAELRGRLESRDILQEALLKSFASLHRFRDEDGASLMAWLAAIAGNEIRDRLDHQRRARRDARREVPLEGAGGEIPAAARSALSRLIEDERVVRLEAALQSLPEQHREVILLRKLEERGWKEIARILGRSEDACRMLLARAMTALTLALRDEP